MIKHFEDKNFNFKAEIIQDRKTAADLYKPADHSYVSQFYVTFMLSYVTSYTSQIIRRMLYLIVSMYQLRRFVYRKN